MNQLSGMGRVELRGNPDPMSRFIVAMSVSRMNVSVSVSVTCIVAKRSIR